MHSCALQHIHLTYIHIWVHNKPPHLCTETRHRCTEHIFFFILCFAFVLIDIEKNKCFIVKTVITVMWTGKCTYFFSIKESKLTYLWCRPIFAPSLFILTYICYIQIRFISRMTANVVWFSLHVRLQFILAIKSAKAIIEVRTHILHYHFLF